MWNSLFFTILSILISIPISIIGLGLTDRIGVQRGLALTFLGFIHYINLSNFINKMILATNFGKKFMKQNKIHNISDVLDITARLVATHQAILCFIFGVLICGYSCRKNFLRSSIIYSDIYTYFSTSYFFYDVISMYRTWNCKLFDKYKLKTIDWDDDTNINLYNRIPSFSNKELRVFENFVVDNKFKFPSFISYLPKEPLMIYHHLFIGIWGFLVVVHLRGNLGDCVFSFYYLMEISTPFVNFRAIFSMIGLKESKIYLYNALIMFFSFFIVRVLLVPLIILYYSNIVNETYIKAFMNLPLKCRLSILAIYLPQLYWFYVMAKGAYGLMVKSPKKSSQSSIVVDNIENNVVTEKIVATNDSENDSLRQRITTSEN